MRRYLLPAAVVVVTVLAVLFFFVTNEETVSSAVVDTDSSKSANTPFAPMTASTASTAPLITATTGSHFEDLWHKMMAADRPITTPEFKGMHAFVAGDDEALNELIRRYGMPTRNSKKAREAIIEILTKITMTPEILAFSQSLVASEDPAMRRDGYQLLQRLPGSNSDIHSLLAYALSSERDPAVLSAAMQALANVPEPQSAGTAEISTIVTQLQDLTTNPDPSVRAAAMHALAAWDRSATIENTLYRGLTDQSQAVREAAISAVGYSSSRSDLLKSTLLEIAQAPKEDAHTRMSSVALLQHAFTLSSDERANLKEAQSQINEKLEKQR